MDQRVDIRLSSEALEDDIKKANRLVELLREAQQIIDSLSGAEKSDDKKYFDPAAELVTLEADLADAQRRYREADEEGRQYLRMSIREIERDIRRNSTKKGSS